MTSYVTFNTSTAHTQQPDAATTTVDPVVANLGSALYYMKGYFVPTISFLGILLDILVIVAVCHCRDVSVLGKVAYILASVGNIGLLLFRACATYWLGDGLNFTSNGAINLYPDSISIGWCKFYRAAAIMGELLTAWMITLDTCEFYGLLSRSNRARRNLALTVVCTYFILTSGVVAATVVFAAQFVPIAGGGFSCSNDLSTSLSQSLVITMQCLMYTVPMVAQLVAIGALTITRWRKAGAFCTACSTPTVHEKAIITRAVTYFLLQTPVLLSNVLRTASIQLRHEDPLGLKYMTTTTIIIALFLPSIDGICTFAFLEHFRESLRLCGSTMCHASRPGRVTRSRPVLVSSRPVGVATIASS